MTPTKMVGVVSFDIMREFFHGWRRKAGVMTLVVALSAAGVWVRASVLCEQIDIQIGHRHHMITLAHDGLAWLSMDGHLRRGWIHHGYMAEDVTAVGAAKIWMRRGNAMERSPSPAPHPSLGFSDSLEASEARIRKLGEQHPKPERHVQDLSISSQSR
jgi:hypothetical protein